MLYRIELRPLMPYFFGGEVTFPFRGSGERSPYLIRSEPVPPQSTLFGTLRYVLLEMTGQIREGTITRDDGLIGPATFSFDPEQKQTFGRIEEISPLLIQKYEGTAGNPATFFNTPLNHVVLNGETVRVIRMVQPEYALICDGRDKPFLPGIEDENGKEIALTDKHYSVRGYLSSEGKYLGDSEIFSCDMRTGINARRNLRDVMDDQDAYFKKEYCSLQPGYFFTFWARLLDGPEQIPERYDTVVSMGQMKSPFSWSMTKCETDAEITAVLPPVPDALKCSSEDPTVCFFALSDCFFPDGLPGDPIWYMLDRKPFHTLRTVPEAGSYYQRFEADRTEQRVMIRRGSVLYYRGQANEEPLVNGKDKYKAIGMNHFIRIGG